jgi:hypothetical protein
MSRGWRIHCLLCVRPSATGTKVLACPTPARRSPGSVVRPTAGALRAGADRPLCAPNGAMQVSAPGERAAIYPCRNRTIPSPLRPSPLGRGCPAQRDGSGVTWLPHPVASASKSETRIPSRESRKSRSQKTGVRRQKSRRPWVGHFVPVAKSLLRRNALLKQNEPSRNSLLAYAQTSTLGQSASGALLSNRFSNSYKWVELS